jgi:hypothetical protein
MPATPLRKASVQLLNGAIRLRAEVEATLGVKKRDRWADDPTWVAANKAVLAAHAAHAENYEEFRSKPNPPTLVTVQIDEFYSIVGTVVLSDEAKRQVQASMDREYSAVDKEYRKARNAEQ